MAKVLVLHGPNLSLLGSREVAIYGEVTLHEINHHLSQLGEQHKIQLDAKQTDAEHEMVRYIHRAVEEQVDFIIINAGAYTHTSIAIRDALAASKIPFIEVHLSNVFARESFRHHSYLSALASGVIVGCGAKGYELALFAVLEKINRF